MSISGETAAGRPKKHVLRYTGVAVNQNLAETQRITKYPSDECQLLQGS